MKGYYIAIVVGVIQILLSINLIIRRRNEIAILSEIISSLMLLYVLNGFSLEVNTISCKHLGLTVIEYIVVKVFLVLFMIVARTVSFYMIRDLCAKKQNRNSTKLRIAKKFYKAKYWPRLKLGLPGMANKKSSKTKVKFDSKGFPQFKSYYTIKLDRKNYKKTREQHFYIANKMLYKEVSRNSRLRSKFTKQDLISLSQGKTPSRYTWHHYQKCGVLQLVDFEIHSKTSHIGGYSIWGSK